MNWQDCVENGIAFFIIGMLFLLFTLGIYSMCEILLKNSIAAIIATFFVIFVLYWIYKKYYDEDI